MLVAAQLFLLLFYTTKSNLFVNFNGDACPTWRAWRAWYLIMCSSLDLSLDAWLMRMLVVGS